MEATTFTELQVQVNDFPFLKGNILHRFPLHPQSDENVYSFIFFTASTILSSERMPFVLIKSPASPKYLLGSQK